MSAQTQVSNSLVGRGVGRGRGHLAPQRLLGLPKPTLHLLLILGQFYQLPLHLFVLLALVEGDRGDWSRILAVLVLLVIVGSRGFRESVVVPSYFSFYEKPALRRLHDRCVSGSLGAMRHIQFGEGARIHLEHLQMI